MLETGPVQGYLRYMDDFVFWTETRREAWRLVDAATDFLDRRLALESKEPVQVNRSDRGLTVCGFRVLPHTIRLGQRRRKRYREARRRHEADYLDGRLNAQQLQRAHDSALAITVHADATAWRRSVMMALARSDWYDQV